jgi:hypothetical protein
MTNLGSPVPMRALAILALAGFLSAEPSVAQEQEPPYKTSRPTEIVFLSGTCEKLSLANKNLTAPCCKLKLRLSANDYLQYRTYFFFSGGKAGAVSFSGLARDQSKPHRDHAIQPIDLVLLTENDRHTRLSAVGQCEFSNPARPSRLICEAKTTAGVFEGTFLSDGHPPRIMVTRGRHAKGGMFGRPALGDHQPK